jgi:hypothetical protein
MVSSGVTEITGSGFTETVTCEDAVHPLFPVAVTVYVVVENGVAVTMLPVEELNVDEGLQV